MKNIPQKIKCSHCKSKNTLKWTKRKTQNRGLIQRYKCNDCQATFTIDDGFFRMRNSPQKITCALDLFYNGVSTRKVQSHFKAFYTRRYSPSTVEERNIYKGLKIMKDCRKLRSPTTNNY